MGIARPVEAGITLVYKDDAVISKNIDYEWTIFYGIPITLRQWLDLLTTITDGHGATNDQMKELLLCLKEQGFLI